MATPFCFVFTVQRMAELQVSSKCLKEALLINFEVSGFPLTWAGTKAFKEAVWPQRALLPRRSQIFGERAIESVP
jgi:hypothetical protein